MEYGRYEGQHAEIFDTGSDRAFEEEVMLSGFGAAPVENEGAGISPDDANEAYTARYTHETVAMGFSITEEAVEDNLYDRLASRCSCPRPFDGTHWRCGRFRPAQQRFTAGATAGGDGVALCDVSHPLPAVALCQRAVHRQT